MKQLEDSRFDELSPAQRLLEQILNHSVDLEEECFRQSGKSRHIKLLQVTSLGLVNGTFAFYFNNRMYQFDCRPGSRLYEIRRVVNGNFSVSMSIGTDISAKLIKG